jgi:hypothetical protein
MKIYGTTVKYYNRYNKGMSRVFIKTDYPENDKLIRSTYKRLRKYGFSPIEARGILVTVPYAIKGTEYDWQEAK